MAKFTINHNEDYSVIGNSIFKDNRLSWKAKGLLANMLALPDKWDYSLAGLVTLATDGESGTRTGLGELEKYGYLIRTPVRDKGKIVDWDYQIYEKPNQFEPVVEKPQVEKPQVEKPLVENRTQYNNKQSITKELNNKECILIVDYLNQKAGTHYRVCKSNASFIKARLVDYSIDDLKKVIDKKTKEWLGTPMQKYLRPETLFNATKFESYLNGLDVVQKRDDYNIDREFSESELNNLFTSIDDLE